MTDTKPTTTTAAVGFTFTIPLTRGSVGAWPVSVNRMYRRTGALGRPVLTVEAARWKWTIQDNAWAAMLDLPPTDQAALRDAPRWLVTLRWRLPASVPLPHRFDGDALGKSVWDAIAAGTRKNDRYFRADGDSLEYTDDEPPSLTVTVTGVSGG